jgi:hypothetical protein
MNLSNYAIGVRSSIPFSVEVLPFGHGSGDPLLGLTKRLPQQPTVIVPMMSVCRTGPRWWRFPPQEGVSGLLTNAESSITFIDTRQEIPAEHSDPAPEFVTLPLLAPLFT